MGDDPDRDPERCVPVLVSKFVSGSVRSCVKGGIEFAL